MKRLLGTVAGSGFCLFGVYTVPGSLRLPDRAGVGAMSAYSLRVVALGWKLGDIYRGKALFMVLQLVGLARASSSRSIALWFPNWLSGR